jgi:hypothetical protein
MASTPGGQFVFSVPGQDVLLALSSNGIFPPPTDSAFDIAIFTDFNHGVPVGTDGTVLPYEGTAFAPNGELKNNFLTAPFLQMVAGDYWVTDFGGSDSIFGGSGNQTITGGIFTTVVGGSGVGAGPLTVIMGDRGVFLAGDIPAATVNALVDSSSDRGELIDLGPTGSLFGGNATVFATGDDTVNAGQGKGEILFFGQGDLKEDALLTISGGAAGQTYTVGAGAGDSLVGAAETVKIIVKEGADSVALGTAAGFGGPLGATVNALAGDHWIQLGENKAVVFAGGPQEDFGDSVISGQGTGAIILGTGANPTWLQVTGPGGIGPTSSRGAYSIFDNDRTLFGTADSLSVVSFANETINPGSVANVTINAAKSGFDQLVDLGSGNATVYADLGDTVEAGKGSALVILQSSEEIDAQGQASGPNITISSRLFPGEGAAVISADHATILGAQDDSIQAGNGNQTVNAVSGNSINEIIKMWGGQDNVFAGDGDTIGIGDKDGGNQLWLDSSVVGGGTAGFGTFLDKGANSSAEVTVGTVAGGQAVEDFDTNQDFLFYPNATDQDTGKIIASATTDHDFKGTGVVATTFTLPDDTSITLIGIDEVEKFSVQFKSIT